MKRVILGLVLAGVAVGLAAETMQASGGFFFWRPRPRHFWFPEREKSFQRVGTFANYKNTPPRRRDGFGDRRRDGGRPDAGLHRQRARSDRLHRHHQPVQSATPPAPSRSIRPGDDVDYSPTSVDVLGNQYALVARQHERVDDQHERPPRRRRHREPRHRRARSLGGQPDSVKISPDRRYAAIAIENERSEDLCVGGSANGDEVDEDECVAGGGVLGGLPQTPFGNPPGYLAVVRLAGPPSSWTSARRRPDRAGHLRARGSGAGVRRHQRPQRGRRDAAGEQPHRHRRSQDAGRS